MAKNVKVAGVGMIPFSKPGASDDYQGMGETAVSPDARRAQATNRSLLLRQWKKI